MNDDHLRPSIIEPRSSGNRMTAAEAVALCRFAKACCPQQQFDAYTPDAWFELLGDLTFDDCKVALTNVAKAQPFVSPAEIRKEVARVRIKRIEDFDRRHHVAPPAELADDPAGENRWRRELMQRVGDGEITHPDQVADAQVSERRELA